MSYSIDYFFNSDKSYEHLCKDMNECLDFVFESCEENKNQVYVRLLGIGLDFYIHTFENDGELNFEDYKYYLGLTPRPYSKDLCLPFMAFIASILYRQMRISEGILVYDVQRLLAKYREEISSEGMKDLYDEVSNRFVEFPQHLIDLDKVWQ
jgi:hypothetical protein